MLYLDVAGRGPVDCAADGVASTQHLLDRARKSTRHGSLTHNARDVDDLIKGDVAIVLDVLHL